MLGFLGRRLVTLLFTLFAASVVVFTVLEVLPGDPALLMLGTEARDGHAGGAARPDGPRPAGAGPLPRLGRRRC